MKRKKNGINKRKRAGEQLALSISPSNLADSVLSKTCMSYCRLKEDGSAEVRVSEKRVNSFASLFPDYLGEDYCR